MADLITLQEYKDYANIVNPKDDNKITLLVSVASNLIKAYIGTPINDSSEIVETISLDYEATTIYTSKWPIRSITSITELDRYTTDSSVHVPLTGGVDYVLSNDAIIRIPTAGGFASWPQGPNVVTVTYVAGYETVPADLKLATIKLVEYYLNDEYKQTRTIMGSTIINNVDRDTDFPRHIQILLEPYKG